MISVRFTPHLRRFFPLPDVAEVRASTLLEVMDALEERWPGLAFYLIDESRTLRENVAIWVDGQRLHDERGIETPIPDDAQVHIMQALSGG